MRKSFGPWGLLLFILSACDPAPLGSNQPPEKLIGAWSSRSSVKSASFVSSERFSKACDSFEVSNEGVSAGLFKITKEGKVLAARQVKDTNQIYRDDGYVDSSGRFYPTMQALPQYLGEIKVVADQFGMQIDPKLTVTYIEDPVHGPMVEMNVEAVLSRGPVLQNYKLEPQYFMQTSESSENSLIKKITQCLQGT